MICFPYQTSRASHSTAAPRAVRKTEINTKGVTISTEIEGVGIPLLDANIRALLVPLVNLGRWELRGNGTVPASPC